MATKEKKREYNKRYREKYKEKTSEKDKEKKKEYHKAYMKEYRKNDDVKKRELINSKNWKDENRDKVNARAKEYYSRPEVKIRSKIYYLNKYQEDELFKIKNRLRVRLCQAIELYLINGKIMGSSKGISYGAIIEHLKPFPKDLSKYHIDHIKPLCTFELTDPKEVKKAFAPENHQWLTAHENLSKGGKY